MEQQQAPSPSSLSRSSTSSSRKSLTLDLSNLPPLTQPTPPTNTLLLTNLQSLDTFRPDNLQIIRDLIVQIAPIHTWAPLKSFRRILVSFYDEQAAIRVRQVWDGEAILGEQCRVYFGQHTPIDPAKDIHLALPDAGKLFFISPPPSPPHGWEMRLEDAPNKMVHADDLADALAKLRHAAAAESGNSPIGPADSKAEGGSGSRHRSRSSTLIFQPSMHEGSSPDLPCVRVDDFTTEPEEWNESPIELPGVPKAIKAHTARPPVELMNGA